MPQFRRMPWLWLAAFALCAGLTLTGCRGTAVRPSPAPSQPTPPPAASRYAQERDSAPSVTRDVSRIPDAVPRAEPRSRYGNQSPYTVLGRTYAVRASARGYRERGLASWYGTKFHGHLTSNRERYDMYAMTAAHKTLPLPSFVRVTNLENGRQVVVRVNDRGPFHEGRIIDLSYAAAIKLGIHATGTARVEVVAVEPGAPRTGAPAVALAPTSPVFLQAGAYAQRRNARAAAARLRAASLRPVRISAVRQGGRDLYRVRIGPLRTTDQVTQALDRARRHGFPDLKIAVD